MTFFAPLMAANVFSIRCSLAWQRTWMWTSSGIRLLSIRLRRKSYSTSAAAGKPTSISLKPISIRTLNSFSF